MHDPARLYQLIKRRKKKENNSTLIIDRHDTHNTFKIKNCIIILSQYFLKNVHLT